jgi:hypothetical protein
MGDESWDEERLSPGFDDPELDAVFAKTSPADTIAAVLTEARLVLAEVDNPLDAELWASDILGALGSGGDQVKALAAAAERDGTHEAMAALCALGAVGSPALRSAAAAAADRLAELGVSRPAWAESIGVPGPGECWCYGDTLGQQEVVTMTFWYADRGHVVSVLLDRDEGGGIKNVWVGDAAGLLDRTRTMSKQNSGMIFEMITQADARGRMDRAIAAGECPEQPQERAAIASTRAILRARVALMKR